MTHDKFHIFRRSITKHNFRTLVCHWCHSHLTSLCIYYFTICRELISVRLGGLPWHCVHTKFRKNRLQFFQIRLNQDKSKFANPQRSSHHQLINIALPVVSTCNITKFKLNHQIALEPHILKIIPEHSPTRPEIWLQYKYIAAFCIYDSSILPDSCIFFLNSKISLFMSASFFSFILFVCDIMNIYEYTLLYLCKKKVGLSEVNNPRSSTILSSFCMVLK
jgi:hypothetical protein